jgi:hypothetical protein
VKILLSSRFVLLLLVGLASATAAPQKLTSLNATAKGQGLINISDIDQHKIQSVMVILKEGGDADFTFYADLQLTANGSWSVGKSLSQGIDIKITGGIVGGNATGIGKLYLRKDRKSIDKLSVEAESVDGSKVTIDFVADKSASKPK